MRSTIASLLPLLLAAPAVAAPVQFGVPLLDHGSLEWSAPLPAPGIPGRTAVGEITGGARLDLVVRAGASGARLFLFDGVWDGAGGFDLGVDALDFDVLPNGGTDGRAAIAYTTSSGLEKLVFVPATLTFSTVSIAAGDWNGATLVRCADVNQSGATDFLGLASDGHTVLYLRDVGGSMVSSAFDAGAAVLDVRALQWGFGGALEIAILTAGGVQVRAESGTLVDHFANAGQPGDAIAVLRASPTVDRLAWVTKAASTGNAQELRTLRRQSPKSTSYGTLPRQGIFSVQAADVDGDGDSDLLCARSGSAVPLFLENLDELGGASFDPVAFAGEPAWSPSGSQTHHATPAFADFDNDRRGDVVVPWRPTASTAALQLLHAEPAIASTSVDVFLCDSTHLFTMKELASPPHNVLDFWVRFTDVPADADAIEVTVWRQSGAYPANVHQAAEISYRFAIPAGTAGDYHLTGIAIEEPTTPCQMKPRAIEVRLVQTPPGNFNGPALNGWTNYCAALTTQAQHLVDWAPWDEAAEHMPVYDFDAPTVQIECVTPDVDSYKAEAITRRRKPNPVPNQVPSIPVPGTGTLGS